LKRIEVIFHDLKKFKTVKQSIQNS